MKKLPKVIYIRWNTDTLDEPWLEASEDPKVLTREESTQIVGLYKLDKKVKIIHSTSVKIHESCQRTER